MNRDGHEHIKFFIGTEVEHTPAFGMRTLFVVGIQSVQDLQQILNNENSYLDTAKHIKHIYFGANMSFPKYDTNDRDWLDWENMIQPFLEEGYFCTLDIDSSCVEGLLESGLVESHTFIPIISVKLPYIQHLGYNATIKLDDRDFKASNPGVWCHSLHNLQNREVFTDWSKYTQDEVIK